MGVRASRFTEGGYRTLFREGMRAAVVAISTCNKLIAAACEILKEFGHMLEDRGLDREGWSTEELELMEKLVVDQLRHRIHMRNAEFSHP